ncbi:hypothetical protein GQ457_15G004460 [Hibiscus cannabinus]
MLMNYNWTEILKRKDLYRYTILQFYVNHTEINEISSNKAIMLAESRVRCIINNAKCILKASISKDLLKHGFRHIGPVIVYSFMQATGLTIDHLVDCFRYNECLTLAERPWRHI